VKSEAGGFAKNVGKKPELNALFCGTEKKNEYW
jgi:hypothetical protein